MPEAAPSGDADKKPNRFRSGRIWRRFYLSQLPRRKRMVGTLAHRLLGNRLLDPHLWHFDRESTARGVAVGAFSGMLPIPGLQILLAIVLCFLWRVNIIAAAAATFISNPFTGLFLVWLQITVGRVLLYPESPFIRFEDVASVNFVVTNGKALVLGGIITAVIAAPVTYLATRWSWNGFSHLLPKKKHSEAAPTS